MKELIEKISDECHGHRWTNMEQEETLRGVFIEETHEKLWIKNTDDYDGFSEEYVFWLEKIVLTLTEPKSQTKSLSGAPEKN